VAQPVEQETHPGGRAYRVDLPLLLLILLGSGFFLLVVPFRSNANYIDWVTGGWIGLLLGLSEGQFAVLRLQACREGSMVALPHRRGMPVGLAGGPVMFALLGVGYLVLALLPGPVAELSHTPLFTFNTICGAWWAMWVVYLGALLSWALWRAWNDGRPLRVTVT
jgi:hypothetical protein